MEWVVLETAPNQMVAEMWCELLRREGVPAFARIPDALAGELVQSVQDCGVMVPETHLRKAAAVLDSILKPKPRRRRR